MMNTTRRISLTMTGGYAIASAVTMLTFASSAQAQTLTDITLVRLNPTNNNTINEGWNTRGNEQTVSNLYLLSGDTFVNPGNDNQTSIAISLSAPGSYTFGFAGENVNSNTSQQLGINFFLNGNATNPRISARGLSGGGFLPNGGTTNLPDFSSTVPGANSLSFDNNGLRITLTNFSYNTTSGSNQVDSFTNTPGGIGDTTGTFTLNVAPVTVPELSPLALLALGGAVGVFVRRRNG